MATSQCRNDALNAEPGNLVMQRQSSGKTQRHACVAGQAATSPPQITQRQGQLAAHNDRPAALPATRSSRHHPCRYRGATLPYRVLTIRRCYAQRPPPYHRPPSRLRLVPVLAAFPSSEQRLLRRGIYQRNSNSWLVPPSIGRARAAHITGRLCLTRQFRPERDGSKHPSA